MPSARPAAILDEHLEGRPVAKARRFSADDMVRPLGIPPTPARLECGPLAWRALPARVESAAIGSNTGSATA